MNKLQQVQRNSKPFVKQVTTIMQECLQDVREPGIVDIMKYHPIDQGHHLRPMLVYMTAKSFGREFTTDEYQRLCYFAATVELMHNASLLHDDLLDQEEARRNRPCLYRKYGFHNGLLVGNVFYIKAILIASQYLEQPQSEDLLESALAMCEGEILQAQYQNTETPLAAYRRIIRYKTGQLTGLACRQAAALMGGDVEQVKNFGMLGEMLGVVYQLRDDQMDQDVTVGDAFDFEQEFYLAKNDAEQYLQELTGFNHTQEFQEMIDYFEKSKK